MSALHDQDLGDLLDGHGRTLLKAARSWVRSEADAEDAVQDAMTAVLAAPHLFAVVEDAGAWLYTLVRRRCVDILRREDVRRSYVRESGLAALFDDAPDAVEHLEQREVVAAVASAASSLDEPLRFVFTENAIGGKTFNEISEQSGIPMGTLMARKQRALEAIKESLRAKGILPSAPENEEENMT